MEDIYEMPIGVVIVSGMAHMHTTTAEIHLFNNGSVTKLFNLLGAPRTSWLLPSGELLINSPPHGSQVLTKSGMLKRVVCNANKSVK